MPARRHFLTGAALLASALHAAAAHAQTIDWKAPPAFTPSLNDWGEHGLMQVPSARLGADGDFNFTFSHVHPYDRYDIYMTPLPWLEAGFRYTAITNRPYGPVSFSGNQSYKDRSFDLRLRLTDESAGFPATTLGIRDIAGTGLFSSEYLVANRRYYDFDFTLGLGWGLMSSNLSLPNMFGFIKSMKTRPPSNGAGSFQFDYFRGEKMGLFGGIEYHTPIDGLRLKLELDPNDYQNDPLGNRFNVKSPVNFGVVYDPYSFIEMSAGLERGNTLMLRISLTANFNALGFYRDETKPPQLVPRPNPGPEPGVPLSESTLPRVAHADPPRVVPATLPRPAPLGDAVAGLDRLYAGARTLGYTVEDVAIDGDTARLAVSPPAAPGDAAALRRLAAESLPGVERAEISGRPGGTLDRLYSGARDLGYDIADVAIDGDVARLTVSPGPRSPAARGALERLAVANLPGVTRAEIAAPAPDEKAIAAKIFADLRAIDFTGENFALRGAHAWLRFSQDEYRFYPVAIGRAARVVAKNLPPDVEVITLDLAANNVVLASVTLQRRDLERAVADAGSPEEVWAHTELAGGDADNRPAGIDNPDEYPNYVWALNPAMRQQLGGPNNFLIYQIYAALSGRLNAAPGISFDGVLGANLFNNLNALQLQSNSTLPHVRSDIASYLKEGKTGIFRAQGDYITNIAPDWYGRVSGGLLEEMFAGVDGEVLYRPYHRRWAIGLDLNHVWQRSFHELFNLRAYQVTTGHLSFYYKLPFYNLQAAVRVGRYLAGDEGATIELSREFAGGVRAGVFVTRTNVSAAQFGEGSFDKGFIITIPLDLLFGAPSRTFATYVYRPLTRDGGQMLAIDRPLYNETDGYDPARLSRMWPHLLE